ncbi:tetratricopeptide repeat protein [Bacteroidota bacterium]
MNKGKKNRINLLLTILLLYFPLFVLTAQNQDDFQSKFDNASTTEKITLLIQEGNTIKPINPNKALEYSIRALDLAKEIDSKILIVKSEMALASCFKHINDYQSSIVHYENALKYANILEVKYLTAKILIDLGYIYGLISDYEKALELNLQSLQINKDIEDNKGIAESLHNIAIIYYYILNFNKARKYNFQALDIFKKMNDSIGIGKSLSNIAMIYTSLDSLDKALYYNFKALDLMKLIQNNEGTGNSYTNIGIAYFEKKNYNKALKYLNKALEIFDKTSYLRNRTLVLANIGIVYYETGDYDKAIVYANLGYELANNSQTIDLLAIIYNLYSDIYLKTEDFKTAYDYKEAFTAIRDSIFNEESRNKISELEVRIETENKTKENELLKKTNRLQLILFFAVSILIIIIVIVLYSRFRTKKKANMLLAEKNKKITEQNASLEILNRELNEANVAKDKFFSIMAHDLKSPLWWFKNVTELLSNKYDQLSKEKILEITKVLDDSAQTSLHLIENLLQWSRSQSGKIEFIPETINFNSVIGHIMAHHKLHAEDKNIKIISNIPENDKIIADKNMLYSILRNLISNAIKFTPKGGDITIDFNDNPDNYEISVKDTGVGIKTDDIDKIFRIDIQTTTLGTAKEKGTGLGLIITKEFIEKHGGELSVESNLDEGSKFIFTIPKK